jgi:hypothetical protein
MLPLTPAVFHIQLALAGEPKHGLIEEIDEQPDPVLSDERRRYYRLTPFGTRVLKAEVERMADLMEVARSKSLLEEAILCK